MPFKTQCICPPPLQNLSEMLMVVLQKNRLVLTTTEKLGSQKVELTNHYSIPCFVNLGFVVAGPGYPEEVIVECVPPDGYPDTWNYGIWLLGQWSNLANISKCIDPNLCYNDPPALPADFSVQWNETTAKPNTVNTTLNYTCGRICKGTFINYVTQVGRQCV